MFGQGLPIGFAGGGGPVSVDFLLVAGGGGARANFNKVSGAGGGGYRTSWSGGSGVSGGGSNLEPQLALEPGVTYAITVAGGGSALYNVNGGNSYIIGGTINISCTGGGGGNANPAKSGGSGAGGYYTQNTSINPGGSGTAGEGYSGGRGRNYSSGGGGGAGSTGFAGSEGGNNNSRGGNGGDGLYNTITGSSIGYSGGTAGSGDGLGFGTTPVDFGASVGGSSRANSGGALSKNANQAAGSGICVLRIPTASYSGIVTGSPLITTSGSDTIITFTGSGSYTA